MWDCREINKKVYTFKKMHVVFLLKYYCLQKVVLLNDYVVTHKKIEVDRYKEPPPSHDYGPGVFTKVNNTSGDSVDGICYHKEGSEKTCDAFKVLSQWHGQQIQNGSIYFYAPKIDCLPATPLQKIAPHIYKCDCGNYYYKMEINSDKYTHLFYIIAIISVFVTGWFVTVDQMNRQIKQTEMVNLEKY